jgi:hypothetical protein
MRMAFGLVSVLVVLGIVLIWFKNTQIPVIEKGQETRKEAQQISGRGPDEKPASESVKLDTRMKNGQIESLLVTDVTPGGAMEQYFGLQKGDEIVKVGEFDVRGHPLGDGVNTAVFEAAQRQQPLVVLRNGQRVTLTPTGGAGGAAGQRGKIQIPLH